jgi:hypothetical protein
MRYSSLRVNIVEVKGAPTTTGAAVLSFSERT